MLHRFKNLVLAGLLSVGLTLGIVACTVPTWLTTVEADAKILAPIAGSLIDVLDPQLAPLVTLIENGFNALVTALDTFKASPTTTNLQAVQAAVDSINTNINQLTSAAQIKDPKTALTVKSVVALLDQGIAEIIAQVPAPAGASVAPSTASKVKGWTSKDFKREYNRIRKVDKRFKPLP